MKANKLEDKCRQLYLGGNYDQALETCLKEKQLWESIGHSIENYSVSPLLGAIYARKGDLQQAYVYWVAEDHDNGTMSGIPDLQARLAAQRAAGLLRRYSEGNDVDYKARGISAADTLMIILRKYGFEEDANKIAQRGEVLRRNYAANRANGPSTFSAILSAIATGLSGASSGAGGASAPAATSPTDSGGGNQSAELHNECIARDPKPWSLHDNKTVAVLKLRNTCSMPLTVTFCHKIPTDPCWKCEQIGTLQPGESASSPSYPAGCTTTNCSEVQAVFNAVAGTGSAPKPIVNDSCNASVH